jgi:hypothetical protein
MPYKNVFDGDLEGEKWIAIKDYESLYEVSNMGRVKALAKKIPAPNSGFIDYPDVIMCHGVTNGGYEYVNLSKEGIRKTCTVHRLVAKHFVNNPNPELFKIVDHVKGNKKDNRASELEWTTSSINNKRAYDLGLKTKDHLYAYRDNSSSAKEIHQFTKQGEFIKSYKSRAEASRKTGVPQGQINNTALHHQPSAGGFVWRAEI